MLENFAGSVAEWAKAGAPLVTEEQFKERAEICQKCEFFDAQAFGHRGKCTKCGCSTYKLFLSTSRCPIDKWLALSPPEVDSTAKMLRRCRNKKP